MNSHADKTQENKSQSVANGLSQMQSGGASTFQLLDNRPEAVAQRELQEMANISPGVKQLMTFQEMANNSPQAKQAAQLQTMADNFTLQQQPIQKKEDNTGLPDNLKSGMENLSGMSLDDVKVHRNDDKPAQLQAHAYAQHAEIHLGPGQEKHLPHEAWHVVQQKQGRVKPTLQMKGGVNVNDDDGLEKEADVMGAKALDHSSNQIKPLKTSTSTENSVQRKTWNDLKLERIVAAALERMERLDEDPILKHLSLQQKSKLRLRVKNTIYRLELGLKNDWLGSSTDLTKKLGALLSDTPGRKPEVGETDADVLAKQISESLSELEHAADVVLRSPELHGEIAMSEVFIGIRGSSDEVNPSAMPDVAKKDIIDRNNPLPGIDVPKLEADVYYRDGNGYVHVVEVKDSVNALRTKLVKENQYQRQIAWLKKRTHEYGRIVEYFIQSPVPFHRLLDEVVLGPFKAIEKSQDPKGQPWFKLGDEKFTYPGFVQFYDAAMSTFVPLLKKYQLGPSNMVGVFLDMFFGTKELARMSIANPKAIEEIRAAQNNELVQGIRAHNTERILMMLNGGDELTGLERAIIKPIENKVTQALIAAAFRQNTSQQTLTQALSEWYTYQDLM